jgi:hypothetical protein
VLLLWLTQLLASYDKWEEHTVRIYYYKSEELLPLAPLLLWVLLLFIVTCTLCPSQYLVRPVLKMYVQNYRDFMEVALL